MDAGPLSRLSATQIQQLQRVFFALDKDEDGLVSESDVAAVLRSIGKTDPQAAKAYGVTEPIDQTRFIAMMGERIGRVGDMSALIEAFESFDEKDQGVVEVAALREAINDPEALSNMLVPPFVDRSGKLFHYKKCTCVLTSYLSARDV
ncbi:hypothetical protein MCUN1_001783 [Malassezia cuniculi]|uniref:EF-hand domain-containing protein n=1 Tax=Malassezia cuniculi TaxID=948313 RepID=A0AAF0EUN5_9BASI|nr:hypothetical protein MCUN1_001783 [Malassezia cuniculi]